ncbi:hypothetical protein D3C75_745200 [compost metagenome]
MLCDHRLDPGSGLGVDPGILIEHPGDGRLADPAEASDIEDGQFLFHGGSVTGEGDNRDADIVVIKSCEYKPMALECHFCPGDSPRHCTGRASWICWQVCTSPSPSRAPSVWCWCSASGSSGWASCLTASSSPPPVWCFRSPCPPSCFSAWCAPTFPPCRAPGSSSTACSAPWPVFWYWSCWRPASSASRNCGASSCRAAFAATWGSWGWPMCRTPTAPRA